VVVEDKDDEDGEMGARGTGGHRNKQKTRVMDATAKVEAAEKLVDQPTLVCLKP